MNAMFEEVLREVLTGLLITEPNVKRSRIRGRWPGTKRVSRRSRFALACHAQTIQEREKETNRKSTITTEYQKIEKKGYGCMNM